jgi:hypothetical protein
LLLIEYICSYSPYLEAYSFIINIRVCHAMLLTGGLLNMVTHKTQ